MNTELVQAISSAVETKGAYEAPGQRNTSSTSSNLVHTSSNDQATTSSNSSDLYVVGRGDEMPLSTEIWAS